jgi:hypothetical protein
MDECEIDSRIGSFANRHQSQSRQSVIRRSHRFFSSAGSLASNDSAQPADRIAVESK